MSLFNNGQFGDKSKALTKSVFSQDGNFPDKDFRTGSLELETGFNLLLETSGLIKLE